MEAECLMNLRRFQPEDTAELVTLFYNTVHAVNAKDYTVEQLKAWAPEDEKKAKIAAWRQSLHTNITYVVESNGVLIGFSDMTASGYLDRLYVHKDYQGQGTASSLLDVLEQEARKLKLREMQTHASITARGCFERHGFQTIHSQTVERRGVELINYLMMKKLSADK